MFRPNSVLVSFCLLFVVINLRFNGVSSQYTYGYYGYGSPSPSIGNDPNKHPLDPLSVSELSLAASIVRQHNSSSPWLFRYIGLHEPDKTTLYPYFLSQVTPPANLIPRRADVLICAPSNRIPIWAVVNLRDYRVESWEESPNDITAGVTAEDDSLAGNIAMQNPYVLNRLRALGYNGSNDVSPGTWDAGYVADNPNYAQAGKLLQIYFYGKKVAGALRYGHPLDFVAYVEVGPNVLRGIEALPIHQSFDRQDRSGNSVPQREYNVFPEQRQIQRNLNPLKISQPSGPSFTITGHEVSWDNFKLRLGYNPREGPHIYTVSFNDYGKVRPIAYRLSLVEAFLQFGDPRPPYHRRVSYDLSSFEFGGSLFLMPVHEFCRGDAQYLPAPHHNEKAETWVTENSICVMEEDAGVLWAYRDSATTKTTAIRAQRLSVSYFVAVGFSHYFISWRFYQDATVELALKLTGIHSTNLMAVDVKAPPYGNLMGPQVYSQIFQHWIAVRADLDIDGRENTVSTEDIVPVTDRRSAQNPYGNGMMAQNTELRTVAQAPTDILPTRTWKVSNSRRVNGLSGEPVAYKLIPEGNNNPPNMFTVDSPLREVDPWTEHNMWVLPYNPDQIYVNGRYRTDGVATWTRQNMSASLVDTDVVLWHVFNYVEQPTQDTWPMWSDCPGTIGFRLRPHGFFNANPLIKAQPASEMTTLDGRENENSCGASPSSAYSPSSYNPYSYYPGVY